MKPHSLSRAVTALLLAGGLAAAQAQQSPPTGQPMTPPAAAPSGGVGAVDEDEARAIMAARERCGQEAGAQAQQDCMNRAQQDYYRTRPGGAGAGGAMPGPGSASPDAGTGVMPPSRSPGSTGGPGTPNTR